MSDYLYANAPLVEVIAEIHWELQPLSFLPGGGIDPFYRKCLDEMTKVLANEGYPHVERVVPDGAPIEMFGGQVTTRFSKEAKTWPMFQLGPGVFTVNLVPPYHGWTAFREVVVYGLEVLQKSYPSIRDSLRINRIEMRYIDAFRKEHGFTGSYEYLYEGLNFNSALPKDFCDSFAVGGAAALSASYDVSFPATGIENSTGHIQVSPGVSNNESAIVVQFICRQSAEPHPLDCTEIIEWFDRSQTLLKQWFERLVSDTTRKTFGKRKEI